MYTGYIFKLELKFEIIKFLFGSFCTDRCLVHFTLTKNPIAESCTILDVIEDSEAGRNIIFRKCHFEGAFARAMMPQILADLIFFKMGYSREQ